MALNLEELKGWPPEIADLAQSVRDAAANHTTSANFYRSLMTVSAWEGQGAQAAKSAMTATAGDHDAAADILGAAANRMELVHQDAEDLAATIKRILDDAATQPAVQINESTNQVMLPDTSHMTEQYAARVAAKVSDLQERIAAALANGERIDAELAGAITAASGTTERAAKTATSLQDLLLPENGEQRKEPTPDEPKPAPNNLDRALDQLTEEAGDGRAAGPAPMDPAKVEQFKELARQTMLRDGVPPDQIEQRLDAIVAAAQKSLPAAKSSEREPMPKPSFAEGFADGWFNTEEGIRDLIGANGWEELKGAWTDMAKGTWERVTNPVDSLTEEVEHLTKYPEHYLGEVAGGTALTAPGAMFGGEAALLGRGLGAGVPDDVIDMPSGGHSATPLGDAGHHTAGATDQFDAGLQADLAHHFTHQVELEIANTAQDIFNSSAMDDLRKAAQNGVAAEAEINGYKVLYEPDIPGSGFSLASFGERGFVIGPEGMSSNLELAKTVAHEVYRVNMTQIPELGIDADRAASETQAAFDFAEKLGDRIVNSGG